VAESINQFFHPNNDMQPVESLFDHLETKGITGRHAQNIGEAYRQYAPAASEFARAQSSFEEALTNEVVKKPIKIDSLTTNTVEKIFEVTERVDASISRIKEQIVNEAEANNTAAKAEESVFKNAEGIRGGRVVASIAAAAAVAGGAYYMLKDNKPHTTTTAAGVASQTQKSFGVAQG